MALYVDTGAKIEQIFPHVDFEEYTVGHGEVLLLALSDQEMTYLPLLIARGKIPRDVTSDYTFERKVLHLLLLPRPLDLQIIKVLVKIGVCCEKTEENFESPQIYGDLSLVFYRQPI